MPSGDSPGGTRTTIQIEADAFFAKVRSTVPVGGSPTGAGESPALPIFQTGSELGRPEIPVHATDGHSTHGLFQNETYGNRGTNCGWDIGTCVLRAPHEGVAEMLSPGSYGHGGAWGTQAWIDPVKGVAYVLMVQ